ncbi:hypothetical protein [Sphingobium lactosutens]|uniref:hypothetical protein n=1 Tax=Sphingobium lactosutens TaxID=522773 RepID=UPI0015B7DFE3
MWTDITRGRHASKGLRLPTDLTAGEWEILQPFLPPASSFTKLEKATIQLQNVCSGLRHGRESAINDYRSWPPQPFSNAMGWGSRNGSLPSRRSKADRAESPKVSRSGID